MSIQSTMYIGRQEAINRIDNIDELLVNKDYRELENETNEHFSAGDFKHYVDSYTSEIIRDSMGDHNLNKWTDDMLGDKMDDIFFRYSMFDNYLVSEDDDNDY